MKTFRIISAILLVALMITIFCFSSQTATESSQTSGGLITAVVRFFYSDFDEMSVADKLALIESFQFAVRKGAHFFIYAVLGGLSLFTFITYKKIPFLLRLFISFMICVLYSVSDEIHQSFVPGRSCELRDVFIDSSGALLAILFLLLFTRCRVFYKYVYNGDLMRKKELKELYEEAYERINELNDELEYIKYENEALNVKIKEFEMNSISIEPIIKNVVEEVNEPEKITETAAITPEKELGAQAIGRIIINAAKYCGKLTNMGEKKDIKELINLVLGRTEVAKAEILNIITSENSLEDMYIKVTNEEAEAEDYFVSVLGQL